MQNVCDVHQPDSNQIWQIYQYSSKVTIARIQPLSVFHHLQSLDARK